MQLPHLYLTNKLLLPTALRLWQNIWVRLNPKNIMIPDETLLNDTAVFTKHVNDIPEEERPLWMVAIICDNSKENLKQRLGITEDQWLHHCYDTNLNAKIVYDKLVGLGFSKGPIIPMFVHDLPVARHVYVYRPLIVPDVEG